MSSLRWSAATSTGTGYEVALRDGDTPVATLNNSGDGQVLTVGAEQWKLTGSPDSAIVATLPDGRVFTATGRGKKIGRATIIDTDLSSVRYTLVNEVKSDWIIDNDASIKVAQFTGAAHGVRRVTVDFEPDQPVPVDHAVFLSLIARSALEKKMLSSTMVLTICLALVAVLTVIVFVLP